MTDNIDNIKAYLNAQVAANPDVQAADADLARTKALDYQTRTLTYDTYIHSSPAAQAQMEKTLGGPPQPTPDNFPQPVPSISPTGTSASSGSATTGAPQAASSATKPSATSNAVTVSSLTVTANPSDYRVRLRAQSGQEDAIYGPASPSNILSPLHNTGGLLFPYTPSIQFSQDVDYKTLEMVHTNGDQFAYSRTPSVSLSVTGKFTIQNAVEGRYALAAIHFLRVASKMWFGEQTYRNAQGQGSGGASGLPPPILIFNGLGDYMFNSLKVILRNHSYSIDETAQLVRISVGDGTVRLPSLFSISLTLNVINTPTEMREDFNLDDFRTGALMKSKGGWI